MQSLPKLGNVSKSWRDSRRSTRRLIPTRISILLVGLAILSSSFVEKLVPDSFSIMVVSLSIPRTLRRVWNRNAIYNGACLYSSNSNPDDLDGFFDKGGDMDRLLQELSEETSYNNKNSTSGWLNPRDILSLVEPSSSSNNNNNNDNKRKTPPSPVEAKTIRNNRVYIKHDDQLRLNGSGISGNKARKMWTLNELPADKFPSCLVSYGGPQSNSMLALAAVANYKNRELQLLSGDNAIDNTNDDDDDDDDDADDEDDDNDNNDNINRTNTTLPVRFVYYTKKLPRFLRKQPNGNFFRALSLGMELVEVSQEEYASMFDHTADIELDGIPPIDAPCNNSLWVPQGGAFPPARQGAQRLAQEIVDYWSSNESTRKRPLTVCVPGGTCTTALLLHHELQTLDWNYIDNDNSDIYQSATMDIRVVVIPCVGDATYARRQMMSLSAQIGASPENIPTILQPQPEEQLANNNNNNNNKTKYFSFGKPDKTILKVFQELQDDSNLLVDLIYGAPSFAILFRHWPNDISNLSRDVSFDPRRPLEGRELMYVHSGGLEGINSQMLRYKYNGLVEIKDVQLPGKQNRSRPTRRGNKKK